MGITKRIEAALLAAVEHGYPTLIRLSEDGTRELMKTRSHDIMPALDAPGVLTFQGVELVNDRAQVEEISIEHDGRHDMTNAELERRRLLPPIDGGPDAQGS